MTPSTELRWDDTTTDHAHRGALRVLGIFERGRGGRAVLAAAKRLAHEQSAELTIATVAPRCQRTRCCSISSSAFDSAVRDAAAADLIEVKRQLGPLADQTSFALVAEGRDPPLPIWVSERDVSVVLLPARRFLFSTHSHPAARPLRRSTRAEIRVV